MKLTKHIIINGVLAVLLNAAYAEHTVENGRGIPCGTLVSFLGAVEVFDSSRTHVEDIAYGKKLHCGSWISVEDGLAVIEHTEGFQFYIGKNSFFQILDPQEGNNPDHDHAQLYRGDIVVSAPAKKEARVTTANARARLTNSKAFLFYAENLLETQYVGLEGQSSFENRWVSSGSVTVGVAKISTLGNSETRVHPSDPRLVEHKSIVDRLIALGIPKEINQRLAVITKSESRIRMPVKLKVANSEPKLIAALEEPKVQVVPTGEFALHQQQGNRSPASEPQIENREYSSLETNSAVAPEVARKPAHIAKKQTQVKKRVAEVDPLKAERHRLMKKLAELSVSDEEF